MGGSTVYKFHPACKVLISIQQINFIFDELIHHHNHMQLSTLVKHYITGIETLQPKSV